VKQSLNLIGELPRPCLGSLLPVSAAIASLRSQRRAGVNYSAISCNFYSKLYRNYMVLAIKRTFWLTLKAFTATIDAVVDKIIQMP
jgi:hypothetical protein